MPTKKGNVRKSAEGVAGARLAYDDTKDEKKDAKKKRPPTAWQKHVKEHYTKEKKKNPNYKFSSALKDAKKTYKK